MTKHSDEINYAKKTTLDYINEQLELAWIEQRQQEIDKIFDQENRKNAFGYLEAQEKKQSIKEEFIKTYKTEVWPPLCEQLEQQIKALKPDEVLQKLLTQHPWLEKGITARESLPILFLQNYFQEQLLNLNNTAISTWRDLPLAKNTSLRWQAVNQQALDNKIKGYPYSQVNEFYLKNIRHEQPSFLQSGRLDLNARPSRIDLFRLIACNNPSDVHPHSLAYLHSTIGGEICIKSAPLHFSELKRLTPTQLSYFETLLVNIASEENPVWIVMHKDKLNWTAYMPEFVPSQYNSNLQEIKNQFPMLREEIVDYKINLDLNDIDLLGSDDNYHSKRLDQEAKWHAVLLGRVFPWCRKNLSTPLKDFRQQVPLPVLMQQSFEQVYRASHPDSTTTLPMVHTAFINREPYTYSKPTELFGSHYLRSDDYLINMNTGNYQSVGLSLQTTLQSFDNHQIQFSDDLHTLTLANTYLINAMDLVYHNDIEQLVFPNASFTYIADTLKLMFSYDVNLLTVRPSQAHLSLQGNQLFDYPMSCAARNRFLTSVDSDEFKASKKSIAKRKARWARAGEQMFAFFQRHGESMDLDFSNSVSAYNETWRQTYCANNARGNLSDKEWQFVQIAQMGTEGLNALFEYVTKKTKEDWNSKYKEGAPNLSAVFDVGSSLTCKPDYYFYHLNKKIKDFSSTYPECAPLFRSLSLILPDFMEQDDCYSSLLTLLKTLGERKKTHPAEINEIVLYNFPNFQKGHDKFFNDLQKLADEGLLVSIRIPGWDQDAYDHQQNRRYKARYRAVQNKVLDNQRNVSAQPLAKNTAALYDAELKPEIHLENKLAQLPQPWDGKNEDYPLMYQAPGVQQQQQQQMQMQQEQEQGQRQQQEQEQQISQEILTYTGRDEDLITRSNIKTKIPENVLSFFKKQKDDMPSLFSLWVGSEVNADQVIENIEATALRKIMEYESQFGMGLAKDNLPAGFYLAKSRSISGLILCFDERRQKDVLANQALTGKSKQNPFTVELYNPQNPIEFKGDFRQFAAIVKDKKQQQTLWKFLALENSDEKRIANAKRVVGENGFVNQSASDASVMVQSLDADNSMFEPGEYKDCLIMLMTWAQKQGVSKELSEALFNPQNKTALNPENLKALGQLFNYYDPEKNTLNQKKGTQHWLQIADKIYHAFGPEHFAIWKKRLLDVSVNWRETLDKDEVDAVALSIVTLKKGSVYEKCWWQLVDAHGDKTGAMRYANLWYAYQSLISYLDEHNLRLDEEAFKRYLQQATHLNGQVFLDRLSFVLKNAAKSLDGETIQQAILTNVDKIDWRHNGFYYASRYESYNQWDAALKLSEFTPVIDSDKARYAVEWDNHPDVKDLKLMGLRFVTQRLHASPSELNKFKQLLDAGFKNQTLDAPSLRLLCACIAIGVDSIKTLDSKTVETVVEQLNKTDSKLLDWMNERLSLDSKILTQTLKMRFSDIPLFLASVPQNLRDKLDSSNTLAFINACGRAMQSFPPADCQANLEKLLAFVAQAQPFMHPLFTDYPWLITEFSSLENWQDPVFIAQKACNNKSEHLKQLALFEEQLRSIDFSQSKHLPNLAEITKAFDAIAKAAHPAATRKKLVSQLIYDGCVILYQDAPFRKLNDKEKKETIQFLKGRLKVNFRSQNVPLIEKLLDSLAIKTEDTNSKSMEKFCKVLLQLDNKSHYNELARIIGELINHANEKSYSVTQLTVLLESLISKYADKQHYPVSILKELLQREQKDSHSSVLNQDLNALKENGQLILNQKPINDIISLPLPNQCKSALIQLMFTYPDYVKPTNDILLTLQNSRASKESLLAVGNLALSIAKNATIKQFTDLLKLVTQPPGMFTPISNSPILAGLWQDCQLKLIDLLDKKKIQPTDFSTLFAVKTIQDAYVRMILLQVMGNKWDYTQISVLKGQLLKLPVNQLQQLAEYVANKPIPSAAQLEEFLNNSTLKTTDQIIQHFEAIEQGLDANKQAKRHYSTTPSDEQSIKRVLDGFKRKGHGPIDDGARQQLLNLLAYSNSFAQASQLHKKTMPELKTLLDRAVKELKSQSNHQANARALACMREIVLRKTGMWANHTQMLALIYAAIHNDDSLIHQVRTGQGKSIITMMRTAYLALNGDVVDTFSSKDSLSVRDHDDFAPVLDAMGIAHSHILANSPASTYKTGSKEAGVGAINYILMGNASLFQSAHIWEGLYQIDLDPKRRVAFLDECDHILNDEQTQFNYSTGQANQSAYNYDEWVYRATCEFYEANHNSFPINKEGLLYVQRDPHLKNLCTYLQEQAMHSPKRSEFFEKYIIPALSNKPEDIKRRDEQLHLLLTAMHNAKNLTEGMEFCIRPELKVITTTTDEIEVDTHFAKVMIDSQIKHGATYSDLVQQFLHVILNQKAASEGKTPDFFVEPDSQIALSQNAPYILNKCYRKVEGCTGTAGGDTDLKLYEAKYNIKHVVKLPTHEEVKTVFLPTEYPETDDSYIQAIVDTIVKHATDKPILITCADDVDVKAISKAVWQKLSFISHNCKSFITDTNDSGKAESDIVPLAGAIGTVTISSRMGRGTDIKPENGSGGLMVVRTYPTTPRIAKQERGRQGRNGAPGTCVDIINYNKVKSEFKRFAGSIHHDRLSAILKEQTTHLDAKLQKHRNSDSRKWQWLEQQTHKEKYLKTRTVEQLKHEIKQDKEKYLRRKEYLLAAMSGDVMAILHKNIGKQTQQNLREAWLDCSKQINALWNARLTGEAADSEKVYTKFSTQVDALWQQLSLRFSDLDKSLVTKLSSMPSKKTPAPASLKTATKHVDLSKYIQFYQQWINGAQTHYFANQPVPALISALYGENQKGLNRFFHSLYVASISKPDADTQKLFETLTQVLNQPSGFCVSCEAWADVLSAFIKQPDNKTDHFLENLNSFFQHAPIKSPDNLLAKDLTKNSLLLARTMKVVANHPQQINKQFVPDFCAAIKEKVWNYLDADLAEEIDAVFAEDPAVTELLTTHCDVEELGFIVDQLNKNRRSHLGGTRRQKLVKHLKENVKELNKNPLLIRPLIELALSYKNEEISYLLPLKDIAFLSEIEQKDLFIFLNKRRPVTEENCNVLLGHIRQQKENPKTGADFMAKVFKPLVSFPPNISLGKINNIFKNNSNVDSYRDQLKELKGAAQAFNEFLFHHQMIESKISFTPPTAEKSSVLNVWLDFFNQRTATENLEFFGKINQFPSITPKMLNALKNAVKTQTLAGSHYINAMTCANSISQLANYSSLFPRLESEYCKRIENGENIHTLNSFADVVKAHSYKPGDKEINLLFDLWANNQDPKQLNQCLNVLEKINAFDQVDRTGQARHRALLLPLYTSGNRLNVQLNQQFLDFFKLLKKDPDVANSINDTLAEHLFSRHANKDELEKSFATLKIARSLNNEQDAAMIFSRLENKQPERISLMQYLYHGLINLPEVLSAKCHETYQAFMTSMLPQIPQGDDHSSRTYRSQLKQCFHKITQVTAEIAAITLHPFSGQPLAPSRLGNEDFQMKRAKHQGFFEQQQESYKKTWWTNSVREGQAARLFTEVKKHADKVHRDTYYDKTFAAIWNAQEDILQKDKNTKHNDKGYSRLYDITVKMLITVASDFLADPHIPLKKKAAFHQQLSEQLTTQITVLHDRLGDDHPLRELTKDKRWDNSSLEKLGTDLQRAINKHEIPDELIYLVDNINSYIAMAPTVQMLEENDGNERYGL